jgi:Zn-dependent peptidase ImmA (M78 family)
MSLMWERLAGSTDRFAVRMSLLTDPDRGRGADEETSLSWGAIQLWIEGQNVCAHVDQSETLTSVHWYLLPFLEWLTDSWDPLFHEERLPIKNSGDDAASALFETRFAPRLADDVESFRWEEGWYEWYQRHSLRAARDGGLFPNVYIRRFRDRIELSWDEEPLPGALDDFSFLASRGMARLKPRDVTGPLHQVAEAAVRQLLEWMPESSRYQHLLERLEALASSSRKEQRVAWLAGLRVWSPRQNADQTASIGVEDLPNAAAETQSLWLRVTDTLRSLGSERAAEAALATEASPLVVTGSCQAALLFGAVAPTVTEEDVVALAEVLISQYDESGDCITRLAAIELPPAMLDAPPWQQGSEWAEQLIEELKSPGDWVDIEGFLDQIGVEVLRRNLSDRRVRGVSLVSPHHVPTIVSNPESIYGKTETSFRFTLAHELCHLLFDREFGQRLAIASGPWAPRDIERRANAFAAMFLMPPHLISRALADVADPIYTLQGVRAVAESLKVGVRATIQHLYNLTLMDESDRDALLSELG